MITQIGNGVIEIGNCCSFGEGSCVRFGKPGTVRFGDYCSVGQNVKIVVSGGDVSIGDWSTLHDDCLVLSATGVVIGEHGWFGQNCVIDGTGGIEIGRGVRVGMFSQLWTHVAAGEQIEGCILYGERPVHVADEAWLVGTCFVSSGVSLGRRLIALSGSNITKSFPEGSVIAGSPAQIRPGLSFYRSVNADDKFAMLAGWLNEAATNLDIAVTAVSQTDIQVTQSSSNDGNLLIFTSDEDRFLTLAANNPQATVCSLDSKRYIKQLNGLEFRVLKYLSGNKARFYSHRRGDSETVSVAR